MNTIKNKKHNVKGSKIKIIEIYNANNSNINNSFNNIDSDVSLSANYLNTINSENSKVIKTNFIVSPKTSNLYSKNKQNKNYDYLKLSENKITKFDKVSNFKNIVPYKRKIRLLSPLNNTDKFSNEDKKCIIKNIKQIKLSKINKDKVLNTNKSNTEYKDTINNSDYIINSKFLDSALTEENFVNNKETINLETDNNYYNVNNTKKCLNNNILDNSKLNISHISNIKDYLFETNSNNYFSLIKKECFNNKNNNVCLKRSSSLNTAIIKNRNLNNLINEQDNVITSDEIFIKKVLHNHYLFKDASDQIINKVVKNACKIKSLKNDLLFNQNDIGSMFYIVFKGKVKIIIDFDEVNAKELFPGDCFGELCMLHKNTKRTGTAKVVIDSILFYFDSSVIRSLVQDINKEDLKERLKFLDCISILGMYICLNFT